MKKKRLNPYAIDIMVNRYALRDDKGRPVESPAEIFLRTARVIAESENNYRNGLSVLEVKEKFFELMYSWRFVPNGRTLANAGTKLGQLANCFVLPIEDDLGKGADSIFSILRKAILILQTGGGVGFSFGKIRPKGAKIESSKGKATGAVSFVKVYDTAFWVIGQGGGRRSAAMAVLPVWHPDIEEFVASKSEEGVIENFNISVGITDEFMRAVKKDGWFSLRHPENGEEWKKIKARKLFDAIVKNAFKTGEPGVLFLDTANKDNPVPHLYKLEATNPCFVGSTRIPTHEGLMPIDELLTKDGWRIAVDRRTVSGEKGCMEVGVKRAFITSKAKKVYRVVTKRGYEVTVTDNHRFFTNEGEYVELRNLNPGDEISLQSDEGIWSENKEIKFDLLVGTEKKEVITKLKSRYNNIPKNWTRKLGVVLGWLVGDGWLTWKSGSPLGFAFGKTECGQEGLELIRNYMKEWFTEGHLSERSRAYQLTFGKTPARFFQGLGVGDDKSNLKKVPESIYRAPREAVVGFLQGLFSADGTVQVSKEKRYCSVRLSSSSKELLKGVQLLLLNLGILSSLLKRRERGKKLMPDGFGGKKVYNISSQYELIIGSESRERFLEKVGFAVGCKQDKLEQFSKSLSRGSYKQKYTDVIEKIEFVGIEPVYDLTEPETHSLLGNGFVTHNCGEQFLGAYENCCLGSVNLAEHVTKAQSSKLKAQSCYEVDWEKLAETVRDAVRFLDNVIDANKYVPAVPELEEAAKKIRRIGLSIMGLADMMYLLGIRYGSLEAQDLAGQLMEFIRYQAMSESIKLAKHRGAFPAIKGSVYDPANLRWSKPKPLVKPRRDFGRPKLDWKKIKRGIIKYGIRNAAQLTVAPTGSIATISGLEGYGCEPVFALSYTRKTREGAEREGKEWREIFYESKLFAEALKKAGVSKAKRRKIFELVRKNGGSCQKVDLVPKELREVFVVAGDLTVKEHVAMQAALQRFVDNSISKTINFPGTATPEEVAKAYLLGWEKGLKGMTVYVDGSREMVVLEKTEKGPFEPKDQKKTDKCPECGSTLVFKEGCATCPSCGYSRCDK